MKDSAIKTLKKIVGLIILLLLAWAVIWLQDNFSEVNENPDTPQQALIDENGSYFDKENVALYIHTYGHLPDNYVTKKEASEAGWSGGSVEKYLPGKAIGGDVFSNREKLLPIKEGRIYYECDIDTAGQSSRGAKRIVFSNDGLIYYTDDHYQSFELLYGEP
ncbi:MAG TPA: ribonuclease domain-containing protein [Erysipelotrichaceae bacterium]|nr:ribonuclease domain-containing protein [Erysipelotrichaceae bacterium]HQB32129.1 ribonuclease domain-containing protein [Erysipelotrichaceae bacterium]